MLRNDRMETTISITVRREFLNKKACLKEAQMLLHEGTVRGMTQKQIARELYSHAVIFYFCNRTGKFSFLKEHASPINLRDGGDTRLRRAAFAACWLLRR